MSSARGDRTRLSNTLPPRERRNWAKRLADAQEEVEKAEAARAKVFTAAFDAGISYALIEASTGLGPVTVRSDIDAGRAE